MYHLDTSCNTINVDTGLCITIILVMFQAQIQSGEREGELRFKLAWSKVKKRYDADPVLEAKDYSYLQEMLCGVIEQTESESKVTSHKEGEQRPSVTRKPSDTGHIMAPLQRPPPPPPDKM